MFTEIHEIVFHGNGGYDWETIYNMPIWLRKFTFNKIKQYFDEQNEARDKANNIVDNSKEIHQPAVLPKPQSDYTVKGASAKK